MAVLYPIVLAGALYLMWKSRQRGLGARGWEWFTRWTAAGAFFGFSFVTGFSIGIFLLPVATFAVFWLCLHAPYWREAAGFPVGATLVIGLVLLA